MIVLIVSCMLFFLYIEARIVSSQNISLIEKLASFVCFSLLEAYYLLHLFEKLGL